MLDIINPSSSLNITTNQFAYSTFNQEFDYQLSKLDSYYSSFSRLNGCGDVFLRLIKTLDTNTSSHEVYMSSVLNNSDAVLYSLGIATEYSKGHLHKSNVFDSCDEFIIGHISDYNTAVDWRTTKALKLIEHSYSDFNLKFKKETTNGTTAFFLLDIYRLMSSYFHYKAETKVSSSNVYELGISDYVQRFLLPSLLLDKYEISSLNRLMSLVENNDISMYDIRYSFLSEAAIADLDMELAIAYKKFVRKNSVLNLTGFLTSVPLPNNKRVSDVVKTPDPSPLTLTSWYYYAARSRVLEFLLRSDITTGAKDRHLWYALYTELTSVIQSKAFYLVLSKEDSTRIDRLYENIKRYLKGRT